MGGVRTDIGGAENDGSTCPGRSVEIGSTIPDRKRARLHGRWSDRIDENCNGPAAVKRSNFAREQRARTQRHDDPQVGPIETRFPIPPGRILIQVNGGVHGGGVANPVAVINFDGKLTPVAFNYRSLRAY